LKMSHLQGRLVLLHCLQHNLHGRRLVPQRLADQQ
jgi:hypothetical protein